eukprot:TRINITY_DN28052_c0_g1_i1.p1 TRINITY_DN28052_c0_g1~~TRINITY_DN28052_c0_g1_i1.p1  ORF type:complete len:505 (+),score=88.84 TRINITY_DN28052_c0_g1_i1:50-1516(+)
MLRRSFAALSPKLKSNQHPRNTVKWRPGTHGFYKPRLGASKMKWQFTLPYVREVDSLYHYPEVSRVTGKTVDWYQGEPEDGYEGSRIYGENTLQLKGMPLGHTPEYVQERLRRFFSKFGPVQQCRAEPHPLDPYQCEGTAFVSFRDKATALKALRAPLKFPASLHDKVVSMRHLDSDKTNDPNYHEKAKFWNAQLIAIARQLHTQLLSSDGFRAVGKPLATVGSDIWERELVELPEPDYDDPAGAKAAAARAPWGRGGVPLSKGLFGAPTRYVAAEDAVLRRFGSWQAFLAEPPLDELFRLERRRPSSAQDGASTISRSSDESEETGSADSESVVVVRPRLVSSLQRARVLTRVRMALAKKLHEEFSVWWREGKVPLPEYTQKRVTWWDHKPKLPFDVQLQSRSKDRHRIFDERFLYRQQIVRARNEQRKEKRAEWKEERKKLLEEKEQRKAERRERAMKVVSGSRCSGLLGDLAPLLPKTRKPNARP